MTSFKKLNTKIYTKNGPALTADNIYWKKLGVPVLVKEYGPIDYIDFSPVEPNYFAVTCSVRVQIYNPITKLVAKNLSRFRENAYGGSFRYDGHLICAGGEEMNVKLFDVSTKSLLRLFKGHTAPVHRTFFTHNNVHIISYSDDKSTKLWDIPTETNILTFSEHTDYVRAGAVSPAAPDIILSGSYDQTVKMYDTRMNASVLSVNHGSPVESLLFFPSGGIFLTAGGTDIKIWDALAGGKLLGNVSQHHKTITCLRLASDNKRFMSGSLDRHVKIYDTSSFKVVHTIDYPNAVLSLGVSKNDECVVAGLVDGLVSISKREDTTAVKLEKKQLSNKYRANVTYKSVDSIVPEVKKELQAKYDVCLRKFQFSKALDCVLLPYVANKNPAETVSVLQELIRRKALHKALAGRESKSILQILRFLNKYVSDYRFTRILLDVAHIFLDVYEGNIAQQPPEIVKGFGILLELLKEEQQLGEQLSELQGCMQMLLASASEQNVIPNISHNLTPSTDARKNLVVNLV